MSALADRYAQWAAAGRIMDPEDGGGLEDDRAFWDDSLEEASYEEVLHPRGRGGRWIAKLGGDWKGNEAAVADAHRALAAVTDRYDVPIEHVNVDQGATEDVGRLAGKSKDTIYLSPRVIDDAFMANRHKDWRTVSVNVPGDEVGRVRTITHEYAHILDGELLRRHKDAYKKLTDFLNEQGSYGMPGMRTRLQAGLEAPSAYGTTNRYEFVAEALTDWIHNGEQAHPSSQWIGRLFDEYLGHKRLQEAYDPLQPRGRGGRWVHKLGGGLLELKGDKKLTRPQVHARVKKIAAGLVDFYGGGGEPLPEVIHEPEYLASKGGVAEFRHVGQPLAGLIYGHGVMRDAQDPHMGLSSLRIVAHEAAHSISGERPGPLPGFSQMIEEGAAEVLSLWYWHNKVQPLGHLDAVRVGPYGNSKWAEGIDILAHNVVYRNWVEELMRRAASKVGWDRTAIIDEIERVMRGDHTVRLHFRDETNAEFPLPADLPDAPRGTHDDREDNAVALIKWLVLGDSAKLTSSVRSRQATQGSAPGSGGRGRGDLVRFTEVDASTQAGYRRYIDGLRGNPHAEFVTAPDQAELAAKRVWLSADGNVGVTVAADGEVGNLFRNPGAPRGAGSQALDHAIANGGAWLNCFDGALPKIYAKHGFVEVARLKFSEPNKPDGWDMKTQDSPDVVFMAHGKVGKPNNYVTSWDQGEAAVHSARPKTLHKDTPESFWERMRAIHGEDYGPPPGKLQEGFAHMFKEILHPRNREGEWIESLRSDMRNPELPTKEAEALGRGFAQSLNGFSHGGISSMLTPRTRYKGHHADIWLNFDLHGNPVGFGRFTLLPPDRDGKRAVKLENLFLKPDYQDRGFGTALTTHVFAMLKAAGIDTMRLEAVQTGSYAWARAGFTWVKDRVKEQQRLLREAKAAEDWSEIASHVSPELLAELDRKVADGEFSSEAELAAFGRQETWTDDGHTMWLGKALMLDSRWEGERAP